MVEAIKDYIQILKDTLTALALLAAGVWWAWQGTNRPRLKLEQSIIHKSFNDGSKKVHVVVDIFISNIGNVEVKIPCGKIIIKQILPAPTPGNVSSNAILQRPAKKADGQTCSFTGYTLQPSEGDQVHFPFDVKEDVQAIQVDTFIPNVHHPEKGWGLQTFYDLSGTPGVQKTYQDATPMQNQRSGSAR